MPKSNLKVKATITEEKINQNRLDNILFLKENKGYQVDIGITKEVNAPKIDLDRNSKNIDLVQVALIHEFGTDTIPQRSFLREPFDRNEGYSKLHLSLLSRVAQGKLSVSSLLKILGTSVVKSLKKNIKDVILPLNESETIKRKENKTESDIPLVATGQLIDSITFREKIL